MSINWEKGCWVKNSAKITEPDFSICIAGDWGSIREYEPIMFATPEKVYGDLLPILKSCNLRVVNLEVPLTDTEETVYKDGPNLKGKPESVKCLNAANFDIACLANNHMLDFGETGLKDTLHILDNNNIKYLGAGLNETTAVTPLIYTSKNIKIGLINFCEGEDFTSASTDKTGVFGWNIKKVTETIQKIRNEVDVVIVIFHGGKEYIPLPPPYVQNAFRCFAESGADIVVGHHPHVPQGIEIYKDIPLIYSLGNFIFYQYAKSPYQKLGYMIKLNLSEKKLAGFELIPYSLDDNGAGLLQNQNKKDFLNKLKSVSLSLAEHQNILDAWDIVTDLFTEDFWTKKNDGIDKLLKMFSKNPQTAAAKLRNRFTTPAHINLIINSLNRTIDNNSQNIKKQEILALINEWKKSI